MHLPAMLGVYEGTGEVAGSRARRDKAPPEQKRLMQEVDHEAPPPGHGEPSRRYGKARPLSLPLRETGIPAVNRPRSARPRQGP